jgi:malonyl-CoA/methylmalonyl-CoA synthetase
VPGVTSLPALFGPTFRDRAHTVALEWACQEYTFGDLDLRAARMAGVLAARGLGAGDRLAIYLPNRLEYVDLFLAATRLGLIVVPINIVYKAREAGHILNDAMPRALVTSADPPAETSAELWQVDELAGAARTATPVSGEGAGVNGGTPAALIYTSGTTGPAKGAIITHGNFAANARTLVDAWRIAPADRLLLSLPLFHVHGLGNGVHCWLLSGCRTRLLERFDHTSAAASFLDFRPTLFFGVPTMFVRMLELDAAVAREIGASLRLAVSGSAPLSPQVLEAFEARFGHRILERYGMTETLMTLSNPYEGERRAGTVGHPLAGVEARIVNDAGEELGDGVVGELQIRSPTLCAGYWNCPDPTAAAMRDGWFATGDLAERSSDGYYTLRGRRSDLIIAGGFNIYPREIEELLAEHPGVREVAVCGVPDAVRGEVPVAFVVPASGATVTEEALIAFCREHLASFKVPRAVRFVSVLPRTALGKVQKHALAKEQFNYNHLHGQE